MKNRLDRKLFFSMTMDFLRDYLPQWNDSGKTAKAYRDGLTVFRRYITDVKGYSIRNFTFEHCTFDLVLDYRNWLLDQGGKKESTVNNRLASIKAYLKYAAARDVTIQQVQLSVSEVPFLKVPKVVRPVIEDADAMRDILDAPPNTKLGCRDTMILSLLYDTMIRADELIHLDVKDVQADADIPYLFVHGKGNKERKVPVSDALIPLIKAYMEEFHERPEKSAPFIYTTQHGSRNRMSERNIERIVKKYADIARKKHPDIPETVYPHMFRRSRGTGLYRDGVAIEAIAVAMGHSSIQTTKDHYAFPSLEQRREAMNRGDSLVISKTNEKKEWPDDEAEMARLCGLR